LAIVTLTEYKTHAGITGTADDTRLQDILDEAHAALRRMCNRDLSNGFESATRTEDYETDSGEIGLREFPITSITSITPINDDNTLGDAVDSTTYRVDLRFGLVTYNGTQNGRVIRDADSDREVLSTWQWSPRWNRVRVVYVSAAPAADVKGAIKRMVDGLYASVRMDRGLRSQSLGGWSVTYATPDEAAKAQMSLMQTFRGAGVL
jgi:hypothetical protein